MVKSIFSIFLYLVFLLLLAIELLIFILLSSLLYLGFLFDDLSPYYFALYLLLNSLFFNLFPLISIGGHLMAIISRLFIGIRMNGINGLLLYLIGSILFILFDYSFIALSLVILYIGALAILFYLAIFLILIFILLIVAFMTLAERYLLASIHRRIGPNLLSLLIPFYDGLKLILKAIALV